MSVARWMAGHSVDALCGLIGRRHAVRAARFALHRARRDGPNDPATNGEYALQRWILAGMADAEAVTVLDVGANVGDWSRALLDSARCGDRLARLRLHAFEPSSYTCRLLRQNLPDTVRVNQVALSASVGEAILHVRAPGAGTNSLHHVLAGPGGRPARETVRTNTIDAYVAEHGIDRIDLLKVDTEGHDLSVLNGAGDCLRAGRISVAQFEYNHRWVPARHFLKDAFDLLEPLGYRIGKLTARGMERYPHWDPELESFVEGNYLACTRSAARRLPQVSWWKQ
jgi:FkbM family methyltransferase